MLKELKVRTGWGFGLGLDWFGPNFTFVDLGFHYHPKPQEDSVLTQDDMCLFRAGVYVTLFGVKFEVGRFWRPVK